MLYIYYFDVAAILLTAMLLIIFYVQQSYPTKACRYYQMMLWLNLISSVSDLVSAFTISYPQNFPVELNYAVNMIYQMSHNITAIVFLIYVINLVRGHCGLRGERIFYNLVGMVETVSILSTPFTHWTFYFDEAGNYCHGPMIYALYIGAFSVLFYSIQLFIRNRHKVTKQQLAINLIFVSFLMAAVVFQFFYPSILLESFCGSIAFLMMNIALDNPAMYFYGATSCFNQTAFDATVGELISREEPFTIVAFLYDDLSVFKKKFGADAYDALVKDTTSVCHRLFGKRNTYHLSNHAMVVFPGTMSSDEAIAKLTGSVGKEIPTKVGKITLTPHFCVLRYPGFEDNVNDINETIGTMLYELYTQTADRVIYNSSKLLEARRREEHIVHLLHRAIDNDGFDVYYQPIFEQRTGRFASAEALVRLRRDPGKEFIGPDEFIRVAERNGLILDVGEIVFEKACRCWRDNALSRFGMRFIEVNLSVLQLLQNGVAERFEEICGRYGVDPRCINLEITETASASANERATILASIHALMEKGFSFSLDDYGSGYSTATYLAEMPFDIVKIDKDILWNAMKERSYRVVLDHSVGLVRSFGKKCVVEGVENSEMADLLTSLGCDFFQGYLYSRPIPEGDFVQFLQSNFNHSES